MAGVSKPRKHLSADALVALVRARFEKMRDPRPGKVAIPLADAVMSGFAMFALKDPSLLAFDQRRRDDNLRSLYHLNCVPSDTQMRAILDQVPPDDVRPAFISSDPCWSGPACTAIPQPAAPLSAWRP
jgi:hypothetical protein